MAKILNETRERSAFLFAGKSGVDTFALTIPPGEQYHSSRLTILTGMYYSNAVLSSQPTAGQTGSANVEVTWQCEPNTMVRYQIEAFSEPIGVVPDPHAPPVTSQMTGFLPSRDGFGFINSFPPVPDVSIKTPFGNLNIGDASQGLCGGMVYAAMDFFNAGVSIPGDDHPPKDGPIFDYIVRRLLNSFDIPVGVLKYVELMNPKYPDGCRAGVVPYGRAWRMIRVEWPIIKAKIDSGQTCPLGLILVKSADLTQLGHNHQVLAYGYDLVGDDLTLHIYDPNTLHNDDVTLKLNIGDPKHPTQVSFTTQPSINCFFVTNYSFCMPPVASANLGRILLFEDRDFGGRLKDIESAFPDLSTFKDANFDDRTSSFVILSGNWTFYQNPRFAGPFMHGNQPLVLGPGSYPWVEDYGIKNDDISSLKVVSDPPNH